MSYSRYDTLFYDLGFEGGIVRVEFICVFLLSNDKWITYFALILFTVPQTLRQISCVSHEYNASSSATGYLNPGACDPDTAKLLSLWISKTWQNPEQPGVICKLAGLHGNQRCLLLYTLSESVLSSFSLYCEHHSNRRSQVLKFQDLPI